MKTQKLEPEAWRAQLDVLDNYLRGKEARVELTSDELGAQVEADWVPLIGISYDRENDLVEIALRGSKHRIHEPREIFFAWADDGLRAVEIVDDDNDKQIVTLRDVLALPAGTV